MTVTWSRWFATIAAAALVAYLALVALPGLELGSVVVRTRHATLVVLAAWLGIAWLAGILARRESGRARLANVGLASVSILVSLVAADTIFTVWRTASAPAAATVDMARERESDAVLWHGELYPRLFHPTELGFVVYKPGVSLQATTYGDYYERRLLESPLLRDSVLVYRPVTYRINRHGLREDSPLEATRVFALGDSFVFGFATDERSLWPELLERSIGEPVYNLGISGSGPMQHVQLLEHMLTLHADSMRVEHLLWLIFEGNDLEGTFEPLREPPASAGRAGRLDGTVAGALAGLPRLLREQSILHALLSGGLSLREPDHGGTTEVDGIELRAALFHSDRWGYRLFSHQDIASARLDSAAVRNHPNAVAFAETVATMKEMADRYGFRVTVILAPTDVRLHGESFEGMPELEPPHFLDLAARLAEQAGFGVVDLARLMAPYAAREPLYWRDDHHWNPRGNALAAELIEAAVAF